MPATGRPPKANGTREKTIPSEEPGVVSLHAQARAAALVRIAEDLIPVLHLPSSLRRACQLTAEILRCDISDTLLLDERDGSLVQVANHGTAPGVLAETLMIRFPSSLTEGILDRVRHVDVVQRSVEELEEPAFREMARQHGMRVVLNMAIRRGDEPIGVHTAIRRRDEPFSDAEMALAGGMSKLVSIAVANATAIRRVEELSRLKSDFLAAISHELRTPLHVIIGYHEMLLEGECGPLPPEATETLARADRSARGLLALISTVLDVSRLDAARVPLEVTPVALDRLIADVAGEATAASPPSQVVLRWQTDLASPILETDAVKLKIALRHLVENALKFTDRGEVSIEANAVGDQVEIAVKDTGIGIAPEDIPAIFEPFRQLGEARTSRGGVGLGLYVVRQALALLGGRIRVSTALGAGSTFFLTLPRILRPSSVAGAAAGSEGPPPFLS